MRNPLWLQPIAALLNRLLSQDPHFFSSLQQYHHHCCAIHLEGLHLTLFITIEPKNINLSTHPSQKIHCHIYGAPFTLIRMLQDSKAKATTGLVSIKGDVHFAQQLLQALHQTEFDWEELIAQLSNDHVAAAFSALSRFSRNMSREIKDDWQENIYEYCNSDDSMLIPTERVSAFCNHVDELKHDSARLEARLRKLENQLRS